MFSILSSFVSSSLINTFWVTTVEASSHQVKLLEIPLPTGGIPKTLTFPLYEQESIQYFSAGLGKEERSLTYPPFPLKLIFVQGERAFLAGVSVQLMNEDGSVRLEDTWRRRRRALAVYQCSNWHVRGEWNRMPMVFQHQENNHRSNPDTSTIAFTFRFP